MTHLKSKPNELTNMIAAYDSSSWHAPKNYREVLLKQIVQFEQQERLLDLEKNFLQSAFQGNLNSPAPYDHHPNWTFVDVMTSTLDCEQDADGNPIYLMQQACDIILEAIHSGQASATAFIEQLAKIYAAHEAVNR